MKIDAHQHFWQYHPVKDSWISDDMQVIRRDFMPDDLEPLLQQNQLDGCIAVQAAQSEEETRFLLELAERHSFIKVVVGWVDLCAENLDERLHYFSGFEKLKGFRHIVQDEPDGFMLRDNFLKGIEKLAKYGFTYDILVYANQLDDAIALVQKFPDQKFVLDHMGKPFIEQGVIYPWNESTNSLGQFPNVCCKISGMLTEADWKNWTEKEIHPYLDVVFDAFGPSRLMFGSDWPVCLLAADYTKTKQLVGEYISSLPLVDRAKIMGDNACAFYGI